MQSFLKIICTFFLFVFGTELYVQSAEISGVIIDTNTKEVLDKASFYLISRSIGGYTDSEGRFSVITENAGQDTLVCSAIGYADSQIPVTIPGIVTVMLEPNPIMLDEVVVISHSPAELPAHELTTSNVTVIAREDIPGRAITLDQVLDRQIGVDIRTLGGEGARSEISIRGSTTEQVTVYLDGVPITASGSGLSGLSSIPLGLIKDIEVYRGSSPGTFGAGAMGGVINISTVPPEGKFNASGSLSYGSFGSNHISLLTSAGIGEKNQLSLSLENRADENDFSFYDDRGTYLDESDDGWEIRENSDIRISSIMSGFERELMDSDGRFKTSVLYRNIERGVNGLGRRPADDARFSTDSVFWQGQFDLKRKLTAQVWLSSEERHFYDPEDEAGMRGRQDMVSEVDVQGIQTQYNYAAGMTLTHFQAEIRRETYESSDSFQSSITLPSERLLYGGGAETEMIFLSGKMLLQPRLYYTHITDSIQDVGMLVGSASEKLRSKDRNTLTASLGWRYKFISPYTIRANIGWYARNPDFNEMFGDTGDVVGNTKLENERSINIDSGIHVDGSGIIPDIDMTAFFRKADDLIQRRNYGDYLISENIAKARIQGLESVLSGGYGWRNVFYRVSLSYQQALNKSDSTVFRKKRYYNKILPYHPNWQLDTAAKIDITSKLRFGWNLSFESECYRGPSNLPEEMIKERILQDIVLDYNLTEKLSSQFEISNIADTRYVDRWGYPRPGRAYYISLAWKVEKRD